MKKTLFFLFVLGSYCSICHSQIRVGSNNSIGIGTENPVSKLSVGNVGNHSAKVYFENTLLTIDISGNENILSLSEHDTVVWTNQP